MIRRAAQQDISKLYTLYKKFNVDRGKLDNKEYRIEVQKRGYVFGADSRESFNEMIGTSEHCFVYEENGEILGYNLVSREPYFPEDAKNVVWIKPELPDSYFDSDQSATIHHVIVDSDHHRKKIGSQLMKHSERVLKKSGITTTFIIIQIYPLVNMVSIPFHSKQGYSAACVTMPVDILGFEDYMSLLMYKVLQ